MGKKEPTKKSLANKELYADVRKEAKSEKPEPAKTGRPSKYTEKLADEICGRIINGEGLVKIARDDHMPDVVTVYRWIRENELFRNRYTMSREEQAETLADEMFEIADDGRNDWMERSNDAGPGFLLNGEHIQRSKLRIETRKWIAAKLKPKKYGDRVENHHTGGTTTKIIRDDIK